MRFSDLEVPSEAEVLLATLRCERRQRTAPADHPSTYAADVAAIVAASPASTPSAAAGGGGAFAPSPSPTPSGSFSDAAGAFMPSSSPGAAGAHQGAGLQGREHEPQLPACLPPSCEQRWVSTACAWVLSSSHRACCMALPHQPPHLPLTPPYPSAACEGMPPTPQGGAGGGLRRLSKLFSSCSSGFGGSDHAMAEAGLAGPQPASPACASPCAAPAPVRLSPEELGEPDCLLVGAGWTIPVHRCAPAPPLPRVGRQSTACPLWSGSDVHLPTQLLPQRRRACPHGIPSRAGIATRPATQRRSVLRQRCDHFRARCGTAWADSSAERVAVPDHFSREAVEALLHYCYHGGWARIETLRFEPAGNRAGQLAGVACAAGGTCVCAPGGLDRCTWAHSAGSTAPALVPAVRSL